MLHIWRIGSGSKDSDTFGNTKKILWNIHLFISESFHQSIEEQRHDLFYALILLHIKSISNRRKYHKLIQEVNKYTVQHLFRYLWRKQCTDKVCVCSLFPMFLCYRCSRWFGESDIFQRSSFLILYEGITTSLENNHFEEIERQK